MNIIPNKKQFKKWTLPSKYSFFGLLFTILGILICLGYSHIFSASKTGQNDILTILEDTSIHLYDKLNSKYSLGYVLLYSDGIDTVTKTRKNEAVDIQFHTAYIKEYHADKVVITIPDFHAKKQGWVIKNEPFKYVILRNEKYEKNVMNFNDFKIWVENLYINNQFDLFVLGFTPTE